MSVNHFCYDPEYTLAATRNNLLQIGGIFWQPNPCPRLGSGIAPEDVADVVMLIAAILSFET